MQAIETKYHGPGNVRGARVSARCEAGQWFFPWDHALNVEDNHRAAALAAILKLNWHGHWVTGSVASLPHSFVHVCQQRHLYERAAIAGADHIMGATEQKLVRKWTTEGFDAWPDMVTS